MDENDKAIATSVDEFVPSLWGFIGQVVSRVKLIALVDQINNDRMAGRKADYPVILITGEYGSGRRTLARALHDAVGNLEFREAGLVLGTTEDHCAFFKTLIDFTTFYITNFTSVSPIVAGALVNIVRDRCFSQPSIPGGKEEVISVKNKLIILSAGANPTIHPEILKHVGIWCELTCYSQDQIYQILRQRVDYLNWRASENTLKIIAENAKNNPGKSIKMLQQCYILARSEDKAKIDVTHAKKMLVLCS